MANVQPTSTATSTEPIEQFDAIVIRTGGYRAVCAAI